MTRRTVILIVAITVVVLAIVAFVVASVVARSQDDRDPALASSELPSVRPSPSQTVGGFTPAPTPSESSAPAGPVVTPTGTASAGARSDPIPFTATARPLDGVRVTLKGLSAVQGKGDGIGELDGPAIRFSVVIDNGTSKALSLASVVANVTYGSDETPADELMSTRKDFPQTVAKGSSATATYTFTLPERDRSDVAITVDYHVGVPVTVFTGSAPR